MTTRLEARTDEPSASAAEAAVDATRLRRRYGELLVLDGVSLRVRRGEAVAVVGPSGCGKSTLLELLAGLQQPDGGSASVLGSTDARDRLERCALMPQRDLLLPWRDALANAGLALECAGRSRAQARSAAAPLFERFGLAAFERALPAALSGGMRQRVAFLRTLLAGRPLLLLDEPFGALDAITRAEMQSWLAGAPLAAAGTVVLVTHDVEEALYLADRVVVLSARPARVVADIAVPMPRPRPRRETVTSPEFAELRERALEALGC